MNVELIENFLILKNYSLMTNNKFKAAAYNKILMQLEHLDKIYSYNDLKNIQGIGFSIDKILKEFFDSGKIEKVEIIKNTKKFQLFINLMKIYTIGPIKALSLLNNINTLDDLYKKPHLLTEKQQLFLTYYKELTTPDLYENIEKIFLKIKKKIINNFNVTICLVGSSRRKKQYVKDLDILICHDLNISLEMIISTIRENIIGEFTRGKSTFNGILKIELDKNHDIITRIDIFITNKKEFPFALMTFTGNKFFNIGMRRRAKMLGYTLNDKELKYYKRKINNEKDIFKALQVKYLKPEDRDFNNIIYID